MKRYMERLAVILFLIAAASCSMTPPDGEDSSAPKTNASVAGIFTPPSDAGARVAIKFPESVDRTLQEAQNYSNYFEAWGKRYNLFRKTHEIFFLGSAAAAGSLSVNLEPDNWDIVVLAGIKDEAYFASSFGRPLLLAIGIAENVRVVYGNNTVPVALKPVDVSIDVPAETGPGRVFTIQYSVNLKSAGASSGGFVSLDPSARNSIVSTENPPRFSPISLEQHPRHPPVQKTGGTYTETWRYTAPSVQSAAEFRLDYWYVNVFGEYLNTANTQSGYLLGTDSGGNPVYANQWALADYRNPVLGRTRFVKPVAFVTENPSSFTLNITTTTRFVRIVGFNTGTTVLATVFTSDYRVDWGDGTVNTYPAGTPVSSMTHNYKSNGGILVQVEKLVKNNLEWFTFTANTMWDGKQIVTGCDHLYGFFDQGLTEVGDYFLYGIFSGCKSLKTAPVIPAGIITTGDYFLARMFTGCILLETASALPPGITTGGDYFLYQMFLRCSSLKTAPALPLGMTTAGDYFMSQMFMDCNALETAPAIPLGITTPGNFFLASVLSYCISLKYLSPNDTSKMPWTVYGVSMGRNYCYNNCTKIVSPVPYASIPLVWL